MDKSKKAAGKGGISLEAEKELIRRAKNGDKAAAERLIAQYSPLIKAAAGKSRYFNLYEDATAEGQLALIVAVREYDERRGVKFAAFAQSRVYGAVSMMLARERRRQGRETGGEMAEKRLDEIADVRNEYEQAENRLMIENAMAVLDEREKTIVLAIACDGKTRREIGRELGITAQRAGQIYREAIGKMKSMLIKATCEK